MVRLETTIDDFNKEVDDLMDSLKKSSDEKEKLMQKIKSGESKKSPKDDKAAASSDDVSDEDRELSEWEKRLEGKIFSHLRESLLLNLPPVRFSGNFQGNYPGQW